MSRNLTPAEAGELMSAWMSDLRCSRLSAGIEEVAGHLTYFQYVRSMLSERNKLASDALWDDDFLQARALLLKHGLNDNRQYGGADARKSAKNAIKSAQRNSLQKKIAQDYSQRVNGTHWSVIK